jgi:hypothetical protein
METAPDKEPQPTWIAPIKDALERYRQMSGKQRRKKLPVTFRDVERELGWHEQKRSTGGFTNTQYWEAVGRTLHDYGLYDMMWGES